MMKGFFTFLIFAAAITLLSALIAPVLYTFLPFKFERIFNRCIMIGTLGAVIWALRTKRLIFPVETLKWKGESLARFLVAFVGGVVTLLILNLIKGMTIGVELNANDWGVLQWGKAVFESLAAALVIGLIEEFFFRGFLFTTVRDRFRLSFVLSLVSVNVFYALLHFIGGKKPFIGNEPTFFDSLKLISTPLASLGDFGAIWPGAVGLFIFGVILTLLFVETDSLYPCMGLHAGAVFFLKMDGAFMYHHPGEALIWGSDKGYDGIAGWICLIIMGFFLMKVYKGSSFRRFAAVAIIIFFLQMGAARHAYAQTWTTFQSDDSESSSSYDDNDSFSPLSPVTKTEKEPAPDAVAPIQKAVANAGAVVQQMEKEVISTPKENVRPRSISLSEVIGQEPPKEEQSQPINTVPLNVPRKSSESVTPKKTSPDLPFSKLPSQQTSSEEEDLWPFLEEQTKHSETEMINDTAVKTPQSAAKEELLAYQSSVAEKVTDEIHSTTAVNEGVKVSRMEFSEEVNNETSSMSMSGVDSATDNKNAPGIEKKPESLQFMIPAEKDKAKLSRAENPTQVSPKVGEEVTKKIPMSLPITPSEKITVQESDNILRLTDYLNRVSALDVGAREEKTPGVWKEDRIVFSEESVHKPIILGSAVIGGHDEKGVQVDLIPGVTRRLQFRSVSPGSAMGLFYGIPDDEVKANDRSMVYMRIWVGSKALERVRAYNEKGLQQTLVNLGVISYLKSPVDITFDITTDDPDGRTLLFRAELISPRSV